MDPTPAAPSESPDVDVHADVGVGAFLCDGVGGCRPIELSATRESCAAPLWLWVHLNHSDEEHRRWLRETSGLDGPTCDALLEEETRPRLLVEDHGVLVILRGVNLNPGSEPVDMVSLRIWVEPNRLISLRQRRLFSIQEVRRRLLAAKGPRSAAEMLLTIADGLVQRQAGVVEALEDDVDDVEEKMVSEASYSLRLRIAEFRRQAIRLRRYIAPQREVLSHLVYQPIEWIDARVRARLREVAERQLRLVEEVDEARERAGVAQEELNGRLSEQMNRNMYVLALVAGVFLPLGLLTGLLGINVGGMPGVDSGSAFWVVCALMVVLAAGVIWFFRRVRLL